MTEDNYRQWIGEVVAVAVYLHSWIALVQYPRQDDDMSNYAAFDSDNDGTLFCVQCGSQGLSRQLFTRTFSTTTSEVGRTMKSFPYLLRLCNCSPHTLTCTLGSNACYIYERSHVSQCCSLPNSCLIPCECNITFASRAAATSCCIVWCSTSRWYVTQDTL